MCKIHFNNNKMIIITGFCLSIIWEHKLTILTAQCTPASLSQDHSRLWPFVSL